MGMYTGLRADLTVKPEFVPVIETLHQIHRTTCDADWCQGIYWTKVSREFRQYPFLADFALEDSTNFIPFGGSAYMDDGWYDIVPRDEKTQGDIDSDSPWNLSRFDPSSGKWTFACSLKCSYTIRRFLDLVLSRIASEVRLCETRYEEYREPTRYVLGPGRVDEVGDGE